MSLPSSPSEAIVSAIAHLQAGRLLQADEICRSVLVSDPDNALVRHLLGYIAHQAGQYEVAVDLTSRSLQFAPNSAAALNTLVLSLHALKQLDDALANYQ